MIRSLIWRIKRHPITIATIWQGLLTIHRSEHAQIVGWLGKVRVVSLG